MSWNAVGMRPSHGRELRNVVRATPAPAPAPVTETVHRSRWAGGALMGGLLGGVGLGAVLLTVGQEGSLTARRPGLVLGVVGAIAAAGFLGGAALAGDRTFTREVEPRRRERTDAEEQLDLSDGLDVEVDVLANAYLDAYGGASGTGVDVASESQRTDRDGNVRDARRLFARADAMGNGDGTADRAEIASTISMLDIPDTQHGGLLPGNGRIGSEELVAFNELLSETEPGAPAIGDEPLVRGSTGLLTVYSDRPPIDALILAMMQRYDRDVDGKISMERESKVGELDSTNILRQSDTDSSGEVTVAELRNRFQILDTISTELFGASGGQDGRLDQRERGSWFRETPYMDD